VVGFVDDYVRKVAVAEHIQIQRYTLYASAKNISFRVLCTVGKFANAGLQPQLPKCLVRLIKKFHSMRNEQRSSSASLGIHHRRYSLSSAGIVV